MPIDYEVEYNNRARVPEHPEELRLRLVERPTHLILSPPALEQRVPSNPDASQPDALSGWRVASGFTRTPP